MLRKGKEAVKETIGNTFVPRENLICQKTVKKTKKVKRRKERKKTVKDEQNQSFNQP